MKAKRGNDTGEAARILAEGGLVAIPTETVYGLAANALSPAAVVKIFEAKKRPFFDPLIVHISSADELHRYAENIPEAAVKLAKAFWPGPMTMVLPKKPVIPDIVTSGLPAAGFRVAAHELTRELLEKLPFPLAAPSANPFGYISPTTPEHVEEQLGDDINYILDGGPCTVGIESTIVGFEDGKTLIYRLGGIEAAKIEAVAGKTELRISKSSNPVSPGQLKAHYAPGKPLYKGDINSLMENFRGKKFGVISFDSSYIGKNIVRNWILSKSSDLTEAASKLFAAMREADRSEADIILAEEFPEEGLGMAINDRLERAATQVLV